MCGILFQLRACSNDDVQFPPPALKPFLDCRGPDAQRLHTHRLCGRKKPAELSFYSTVLSLRGSSVVSQPLVDEGTGCVLCWNGEAWKFGDETVRNNDTLAVFSCLLAASLEASERSGDVSTDPVARSLARIAGPFAFVFFDARSSKLYYGRDCLGRRSLLSRTTDQCFTICTVSDGASGWSEVDADGIYIQDLGGPSQLSRDLKQPSCGSEASSTHTLVTWESLGLVPTFERQLPSASSEPLSGDSAAVSKLGELLCSSIDLRVSSIPTTNQLESKHGSSNGTRSTADGMQIPSNESWTATAAKPAKLAILFSGGLDCTVLARIVHDILPPEDSVDLLNVAFENPRNRNQAREPHQTIYDVCPDRLTGRASAVELATICPDRLWRFVEINVPFTEAQEHRGAVVSLMHPHDTEMDLSIAMALYFASRGVGLSKGENGTVTPYSTTARVLLSGLGADELFGGYQRHATAFKHRGHAGLIDELELDFARLGKRNLGRDDRVISHWGREARYPYLDEEVVRWAVTSPAWEKCGFGMEDRVAIESGATGYNSIEPGKLVVRLLAHKLGMTQVAREKKRAIQFGARTAKMEGNTTGTARISKRAETQSPGQA